MAEVVVADALGLMGLLALVEPEDYRDLFDNVTTCLETGALRFPREVVDEIHVIARNEFLSGWASGLGATRDQWTSDIVHQRQVMRLVANLGYDEGFVSLDNHDPAISHVARMCFDLQKRNIEFCVLTTDVGSGPLAPTMEQICTGAGWTIRTPRACALALDLLA
ncbi:MAG: hypothetical protein KJ659_12710 [Actinobacteria bacterium]|nr:hypothetical protein [Actinomycetota bacterium]MBU1609480.1 hypothetical protein [Actinomycetota bacterium]MBU2315246.1 hypothetical protein [Actinomycetota bacterium]MBU2386330.1 hypothetical protein [Actinomycetota bacterium]